MVDHKSQDPLPEVTNVLFQLALERYYSFAMLLAVMRQVTLLLSLGLVCVSAQSGPPDALSGPASATTADLVNDPAGALHLKVRPAFNICVTTM